MVGDHEVRGVWGGEKWGMWEVRCGVHVCGSWSGH